jgi:DNA-binding HxlR family transcriptional regulator
MNYFFEERNLSKLGLLEGIKRYFESPERYFTKELILIILSELLKGPMTTRELYEITSRRLGKRYNYQYLVLTLYRLRKKGIVNNEQLLFIGESIWYINLELTEKLREIIEGIKS